MARHWWGTRGSAGALKRASRWPCSAALVTGTILDGHRDAQVPRRRLGHAGRHRRRSSPSASWCAATTGACAACWSRSTTCSPTCRSRRRAKPRSSRPTAPPRSCWWSPTPGSAFTPCSRSSACSRGTSSNFVFCSVGLVDSGQFKGAEGVHAARGAACGSTSRSYVTAGDAHGHYAEYRFTVGTDLDRGARAACASTW